MRITVDVDKSALRPEFIKPTTSNGHIGKTNVPMAGYYATPGDTHFRARKVTERTVLSTSVLFCGPTAQSQLIYSYCR